MRKAMSKKGSSTSEIMEVNWSAGWKFAKKLIKASSSFLLHEEVLFPLLELVQIGVQLEKAIFQADCWLRL